MAQLLNQDLFFATEPWLVAHPGIEILSRDLSKTYRKAMNIGAPKAIQVADRFHPLHNLASVLETVMQDHQAELKAMQMPPIPVATAAEPKNTPAPNADSPPALSAHCQKRQAIHHKVHQLYHEQHWSTAAIAHAVGMSLRTVQRDLLQFSGSTVKLER
ncbi:transposase [filamentous cyanobacterium LEGE 11480]|uniref:Transposase n=1 Tax=Romeriopsis navalis LEGE 11480 TaxID=2777977 RepID=A0A928VVS4_9CYAN|nr:transposase [Romeriopsis navalis]MBE9033490.1 transposase [Romeriopsis navalis LEGE 11480]